MRLPSPKGELATAKRFLEETVSTLVPRVRNPRNSGSPLPNPSLTNTGFGSPAPNPCRTIALSIEFVAKPEKAKSAPAFLPKALLGALKDVGGFAGCVVLCSDQEARLITVLTFWTGSDCHLRCAENVRWVRALLASYIDRCLRVQTLLAHAPLTSEPVAPMDQVEIDEETNHAQTGLILQEAPPAEETVCVA